jgi:uncharacterized Tic20 family protein
MTAAYEHPSLKMYVTPEQRDRAESWLKDAYADGRISELEFDQRIGQVLSADNRKELNAAFYGLVHVPSSSTAIGLHPAYQPLVRPEVRQQADRTVAALAHFSVFFVWLLGPGLAYVLTRPGSYAHREAAKAFNFQLGSLVSLVGVGIVAGITDFGPIEALIPLMMLAWFVLTIIGGVKAAQGLDWRNPARRVVRIGVLPEK